MKFLGVSSSGSMAGTTYSRNRFGQYQRRRAIPVNPGTASQANVRARTTTLSQNYRLLSAVQRAGWADLGLQFSRSDSLGQGYNLTGAQAYNSVNTNNLTAGNAIVSDAPLLAEPAEILTVTPTITAATFSVAWTPTPLAAGERIFIFASPQRSAGVSFNKQFRLMGVSAAAGTSPFTIFTAYSLKFGAPVVGARIFVSVSRYLGGFVSQTQLASAIVT